MHSRDHKISSFRLVLSQNAWLLENTADLSRTSFTGIMKSLKLLEAKAFFSSKVNKGKGPKLQTDLKRHKRLETSTFHICPSLPSCSQNAPLPANPERGGQRRPVCHLPVQRHWQDRGWRQALASGTVTQLPGSERVQQAESLSLDRAPESRSVSGHQQGGRKRML